jgi:hypothetical protein
LSDVNWYIKGSGPFFDGCNREDETTTYNGIKCIRADLQITSGKVWIAKSLNLEILVHNTKHVRRYKKFQDERPRV